MKKVILKIEGMTCSACSNGLEKYLNNVNTATNVRAKLAYILNVQGEKELVDMFYDKGVREANKCQIKGLGLYEKKLLDNLINNPRIKDPE